MISIRELKRNDYEQLLAQTDLLVPIEQTTAWADYQETIPDRTTWGYAAIERDGQDLAYVTFTDYKTHGYHYLRAHHGPMWLEAPSEDEEREAMRALSAYVKAKDKKQVFMRLAVEHEIPESAPTLSSIPYDTTVVIDITGDEEEILTRMKARGRRDIRKAIREAPITCADETDRALECFDEYYAVMVETAERDGFTPAPASDYTDMLKILGPERARLYAGRLEDGTVANWTICAISGKLAIYYYAGARTDTRKFGVTDRLFYYACCELGKRGCEVFDLMGIGSDFSPKLMGLNTFKTKFTKQTTHVAPDRDVPVAKTKYKALQAAKGLKEAIRNRE